MIGKSDNQNGKAFRSLVLSEVGRDGHPGLRVLEAEGGQRGVRLDL